MPTDALGSSLLTLARNAIGQRFGVGEQPVAAHPSLQEPGATFVTLTQQGQLRGCIGSLEAHRPLAADVAENAVAAAFRDPRVEVSLLEPSEALTFADEDDALARLRPGVDGLILKHGSRRATFLPQVWESLPDRRRFLEQLKLKAGLPADFWDGQITLARYGVQKWKEA